jgi:hypothetical protein
MVDMIWAIDVDPSKIAIEGDCILRVTGNDYFGDGTGFEVRTKSPSWRSVHRYAQASMLCTMDEHHRFFEGVESSHVENDIPVYEIVLGS